MELNERRYQTALTLAVAAHKEQVRKTDGTPYVAHPIMVARLVEHAGGSETAILAALVHDVLEDTAVTESELRESLGDAVVDVVTAVSEDKSLEWRDRKQGYITAVAAASEDVKLVSVADKIHNAQSLIEYHSEHGAETWNSFSKGKDDKVWFERTLCTALQANWNHQLLKQYDTLISELEALD